LRRCHLFRAGEQDEVWVRLDDKGKPMIDGERFSVDQLRDDEENDCIRTDIDAGLKALDGNNPPSLSVLTDALCDDRFETGVQFCWRTRAAQDLVAA
jgi:hypothetical protein